MLMMDDLQYDIDDHLFFYIDFKRNPAGSQMFLPVNPPFVCHSNIKGAGILLLLSSLCFCRRHKNPTDADVVVAERESPR